MVSPLPSAAKKYFWGDNLSQLNWPQHKKYIIQTLLDKGDEASLHWLFRKVTRSEGKKLLSSLKLTPKSANFWRLYLS